MLSSRGGAVAFFFPWRCPSPAGDYTLLEKLFGQTSNNAERMKLKEEVLAKADIPTNPSLVSHRHAQGHRSDRHRRRVFVPFRVHVTVFDGTGGAVAVKLYGSRVGGGCICFS